MILINHMLIIDFDAAILAQTWFKFKSFLNLPPFFREWFCVRCLEKEKSENLVCYDRIPP